MSQAMPSYRVFRLKDHVRQQFRWAPHLSGLTPAKPRDYVESGTIEADNLYAAWTTLRGVGHPLQVGDILEGEGGELRIVKYVGFEQAQWVMPEVRSGLETAPVAAGAPVGDSGSGSESM